MLNTLTTHFSDTKKIGLKLAATGLLATGLSFSGFALAAPAKNQADSKVEFKNALPVTQEEIAVVEVLGEVCPKILGKNTNFDAGFKQLLADMLPTIEQPVLALQALKDDAEYQGILKQARIDANKASVKENREVCLDVVQYQSSEKNQASKNQTAKKTEK